jgi:hypothetical protein
MTDSFQELKSELPNKNISHLKQKILTSEICEYDNKTLLENELQKLKQYNDDAITEFTEVILVLLDELIRLSNDKLLTMNKSLIEMYIKKKSKGLIDNLILQCYEANNGLLRHNIVIADESFFLNNDFDDLTNKDSEIINHIFKFKSFWGKLSDNDKDIIKNTLLAVISLCDIRYLSYKKYICLKEYNQKYNQLFKTYDNYL